MKIKWPPWRPGAPEQRASSYTSAVVEAVLAAQSASVPDKPTRTAAAAIAASTWARALSVASVSGERSRALLSPALLAWIGRALVLDGAAVMALRGHRNDMRLAPVCSYDVSGGVEEEEWIYRVDIAGPDGMISESRSSESVINLRWAVDAARPWAGVGPFAAAADTGRLSARAEGALADEAGSPVGYIIPIPEQGIPEPTADGAPPADPVAGLTRSISSLRGQIALLESTQSGWGEGRAGAPQRDWVPSRIGASPPQSMVELRYRAHLDLLEAAGIPAGLMQDGPGNASREALRRFLHLSVQPVGALLAGELSRVLEEPVELTFERLGASDISGRARAFQSMVGGGMDLDKAAALSGLMLPET